MSLYQSYYSKWGIGEISKYQRSGTEIISLINVASGFAGGDSPDITPDQIYPQLSKDDGSPVAEKVAGQIDGWSDMPDGKRQQLIDLGLCNEEGVYKAPNAL